MPEGHTIHRAARLHRKRFAGNKIKAWSPQGRFVDGAERIDGAVLDDVRATGKHLFYEFEPLEILHIHLGLFGRFRVFTGDGPEPTQGTRLAWSDGESTLYLAGATIVELIDREDEETIRSRIGPDPLAPRPDDAERITAALTRRSIPIGAALLDQKLIAGIGNVYRAELLLLAGIDPRRPANELHPEEVERLWSLTVEQLRLGERSGKIITVDPAEVGLANRSQLKRSKRLYAYKRDGRPCRKCGTPITSTEMGGRNIWWCPSCQS